MALSTQQVKSALQRALTHGAKGKSLVPESNGTGNFSPRVHVSDLLGVAFGVLDIRDNIQTSVDDNGVVLHIVLLSPNLRVGGVTYKTGDELDVFASGGMKQQLGYGKFQPAHILTLEDMQEHGEVIAMTAISQPWENPVTHQQQPRQFLDYYGNNVRISAAEKNRNRVQEMQTEEMPDESEEFDEQDESEEFDEQDEQDVSNLQAFMSENKARATVKAAKASGKLPPRKPAPKPAPKPVKQSPKPAPKPVKTAKNSNGHKGTITDFGTGNYTRGAGRPPSAVSAALASGQDLKFSRKTGWYFLATDNSKLVQAKAR